MNSIALSWKVFSINLLKVNVFFKAQLSANFDGLICDEDSIKVMFFDTISTEDQNVVDYYWNTITPTTFQQTTEEYIKNVVIPNAKAFVSQLEGDFVAQNIALGISAAGKTGAVLGVISKQVVVEEDKPSVSILDSLYGVCPSLTVTVQVLDWHLAHMEEYADLAPFITTERFTAVKTRIQTYLGV